MKHLYGIFVVILTSLTMLSCDVILTDHPNAIQFQLRYTNSSSHAIYIVCNNEHYESPYEQVISQNESSATMFDLWIKDKNKKRREQKVQQLVIPRSVTLVYDNEYSITFDRTTQVDNLCNFNDYSVVMTCETERECCYTFTEADYEYAKENGTRIEKE